MSKIFAQKTENVLNSTTALLASGSISGSLVCEGFTKIMGMVISNASLDDASSIRLYQSMSHGASWDVIGDFIQTACTACPYTCPLYGNAIKVLVKNGTGAASIFRTNWYLLPI